MVLKSNNVFHISFTSSPTISDTLSQVYYYKSVTKQNNP